MWNLKTKLKQPINKIKQKQTHRYRKEISGYQRERGREWGKWVKEFNCMATDGN